jgi:CubicO group peptidase (beta-lactamase class C family)
VEAATGKLGLTESARARGDATLAEFPEIARFYGISHAALGLVDGDARSSAVAHGSHVAVTTPVPAASLTKLFTITAVLRLVDAGDVDLDRPVGELVPEFRLGDALLARQVTIRRLLAHTSGLQSGDFEMLPPGRPDPAERLADYAARSAHARLALPPGAVFSYSSTAFTILGRLVEVVRQAEWPVALHDLVLAPLALEDTVWHPRELADSVPAAAAAAAAPGYLGPSDQIWTSVRDLLTLGRLYAAERPPELRALLSDDVVAEAGAAHVELPEGSMGVAGGLGWRIYAQRPWLIGHWGMSERFLAALWLLPSAQLGLAIAGRHGDRDRAVWLLMDVCSRVFGAGLGPPNTPGRGWDPSPSALGTYELPGIRFVVEGDGDAVSLRCTSSADGPAGLYAPLVGPRFVVQPLAMPGVAIASSPERRNVVLTFLGHDGDVYRYLHVWGQTAPRL